MSISGGTGAEQRDASEAIVQARQGRQIVMKRNRSAGHEMSRLSIQAGTVFPAGRDRFLTVRRA